MQSETFLAFSRQKDGPAGSDSRPRLETGIVYDIYSAIDQKNGWKDDDEAPTADDRSKLIELEARIFRELFNFVLNGIVMDGAGRGMKTAARRVAAIAHHFAPEAMCVEWERQPVPSDHPARSRRKRKYVATNGTPISLRKLAEMPQLATSEEELAKLAQQFIDHLKVTVF